jgi:hypothetical protein
MLANPIWLSPIRMKVRLPLADVTAIVPPLTVQSTQAPAQGTHLGIPPASHAGGIVNLVCPIHGDGLWFVADALTNGRNVLFAGRENFFHSVDMAVDCARPYRHRSPAPGDGRCLLRNAGISHGQGIAPAHPYAEAVLQELRGDIG